MAIIILEELEKGNEKGREPRVSAFPFEIFFKKGSEMFANFRPFLKLAIAASLALFLVSCGQDRTPPTVTATLPANGDRNVAPGPMVMSATFSEAMLPGNYSWAYTTPESFPEINGEPGLENNGTVATLPVMLAPNTEYEVWINSPTQNNFKDKAGNVAIPYKLVFKTR